MSNLTITKFSDMLGPRLLLALLLSIVLATAQNLTGVWPYQTFKTTSFNPPQLQINKTGEPLADGLILFTPQGRVEENASAFIMTDEGSLVWNGPLTATTNLFVQSLDNETVLSSWHGVGSNIGHGYGSVSILSTTYTELYTVCPTPNIKTPDGSVFDCYADLHESFITDHGTMLVTVVNVTTADLSTIGGPKEGWVYDTMFMDIDIKTNQTVFQWSPLAAGIPINSTMQPLSSTGSSLNNPFDWFHMNSVQQVGTSYLANSRHTWSTYMIDSAGKVEWTIQGEHGGDFSLPEEAQFVSLLYPSLQFVADQMLPLQEWQHQARVENVTPAGMVLHYFNNRNSGVANGSHQTNGLEPSLSLVDHSVKVLKILTDPAEEIFTESQGAYSSLSNGNRLMGYGSIAKIKEYRPTRDVRMRLKFGVDNLVASYRAYRQVWEATPCWAPIVVGIGTEGYVSWNGDMRTTLWAIFTGSTNGSLSRIAEVSRKGFETGFDIPSGTKYLQVAAYAGNIFLRNSSVVSVDQQSEYK